MNLRDIELGVKSKLEKAAAGVKVTNPDFDTITEIRTYLDNKYNTTEISASVHTGSDDNELYSFVVLGER